MLPLGVVVLVVVVGGVVVGVVVVVVVVGLVPVEPVVPVVVPLVPVGVPVGALESPPQPASTAMQATELKNFTFKTCLQKVFAAKRLRQAQRFPCAARVDPASCVRSR